MPRRHQPLLEPLGSESDGGTDPWAVGKKALAKAQLPAITTKSMKTQADVTEGLEWIKTLLWTGTALVLYAALQSSVGMVLTHDPAAREELLAQVPIATYQHSAAAFFTAMSLNLISFIFEETADKRQLALLSALIKGLSWHCDRLLLTGQSVILYDSFGVVLLPNRYIQWAFTTPTILFVLSKISDLSALQISMAIGANVLMVVCGLGATLAPTGLNWILWVVSMVAFVYVMMMLKVMIDSAIKESGDQRTKSGLMSTFFSSLVIWSMFPIAWLLPHVNRDLACIAELMVVFSNFAAKVVFSSCIMYNNFLSIAQRRLLAQLAQEQAERIQVVSDLRDAISRKDNFLSIIGHELRTPLNAIIQLSNAMSRGSGGTLTDRGKGWVQTISDSGLHLLGIINDILLVGAMRAGTMPIKQEVVHTDSIIDHVLNSLAPLAAKDVMIEKAVAGSLTPIIGDRSRVIQILSNLVGNSLKFTTKGKVSIKAYPDSKGQHMIVKVTDTGCGIPKDKLSTIWNAFEQADMTVTRKFGGTGLGLNIVKQLVESHDGEIKVDSVLGQGTTVTFRLPVWPMSTPESLEMEFKPAYEAAGFSFQKLLAGLEKRGDWLSERGSLRDRGSQRDSGGQDMVVEQIKWDQGLVDGCFRSVDSTSSAPCGGSYQLPVHRAPSANTSRSSFLDPDSTMAGQTYRNKQAPSAHPSRSNITIDDPTFALSNVSAAAAPRRRESRSGLFQKVPTSTIALSGAPRSPGLVTPVGSMHSLEDTVSSQQPPQAQQAVAKPAHRPNMGMWQEMLESREDNNTIEAERSSLFDQGSMQTLGEDDGPMSVASGLTQLAAAVGRRGRSNKKGRKKAIPRMDSGKPPYSSVHGSIQIFSVDDEEVNQIVLEEILSSAGYLFVHAMDAMEAQEMLDEWDTIPDLMLVDSMMPGMSGQEFISALRRSLPATVLPIIMVSAKTDELNIVSGLNSGSNDFVRKPYQRLELLARINAQLRVKNEVWWMSDLAEEKSDDSLDYSEGTRANGSAPGTAYVNTAARLLRNMLPDNVVERMTHGAAETIIADNHDHVVLLFADIVGFYRISTHLTPEEVFLTLSNMFTAFDKLTDRFGVYKVETIADSYIVAAGHDETPAKAQLGAPVERVLQFAAAMLTVVRHITTPDGEPVYMRIGVHCGPAYAGIVGHKCPRYCFLGETVVTAATIESTSFPMAIHVSQDVVDSYATYAMDGLTRIAELFAPLGEREVQNKVINTFLVKDGNWEEALCTMRKAQDIQRSMTIKGDPKAAAEAADAVVHAAAVAAGMGGNGRDGFGTTRRSMEGREESGISTKPSAKEAAIVAVRRAAVRNASGHFVSSGAVIEAVAASELKLSNKLESASSLLGGMKADIMELRSDQEACMMSLSNISSSIQQMLGLTQTSSNRPLVNGGSMQDSTLALTTVLSTLSGLDVRMRDMHAKVDWTAESQTDLMKVLRELQPGSQRAAAAVDYAANYDNNSRRGGGGGQQPYSTQFESALTRLMQEMEGLGRMQQHANHFLAALKADALGWHQEQMYAQSAAADELKHHISSVTFSHAATFNSHVGAAAGAGGYTDGAAVAAGYPGSGGGAGGYADGSGAVAAGGGYGGGAGAGAGGAIYSVPGYKRVIPWHGVPSYSLPQLLTDLNLHMHHRQLTAEGMHLWVLLDMSPDQLECVGIKHAGARAALCGAVRDLACNLLRWCHERSMHMAAHQHQHQQRSSNNNDSSMAATVGCPGDTFMHQKFRGGGSGGGGYGGGGGGSTTHKGPSDLLARFAGGGGGGGSTSHSHVSLLSEDNNSMQGPASSRASSAIFKGGNSSHVHASRGVGGGAAGGYSVAATPAQLQQQQQQQWEESIHLVGGAAGGSTVAATPAFLRQQKQQQWEASIQEQQRQQQQRQQQRQLHQQQPMRHMASPVTVTLATQSHRAPHMEGGLDNGTGSNASGGWDEWVPCLPPAPRPPSRAQPQRGQQQQQQQQGQYQEQQQQDEQQQQQGQRPYQQQQQQQQQQDEQQQQQQQRPYQQPQQQQGQYQELKQQLQQDQQQQQLQQQQYQPQQRQQQYQQQQLQQQQEEKGSKQVPQSKGPPPQLPLDGRPMQHAPRQGPRIHGHAYTHEQQPDFEPLPTLD